MAEPVAQEALGQMVALMPFAQKLGIELDAASADEVVGRLGWSDELCTAGGLLHGGALMAFADSLGGICAFLNLPEGTGGTATISSSTNMLRAVREGEITATSRPLRVGTSVITVQTELRDSEGALVAQVTQAQAVLGA